MAIFSVVFRFRRNSSAEVQDAEICSAVGAASLKSEPAFLQ
jgi:hypothetical protein